MSKIQHPLTLEGNHVRLEPLSLDHLSGLCKVGLDEKLWMWTPRHIGTRQDMEAYIREAVAGREEGTEYPFVTTLKSNGLAVGSTRFGNIALANKRLEIGWTWVAAGWQRSAVNSEAKLLMLEYAFDVLDCNRVELKTDALNVKSRRGIVGIGGTEEGILRHHIVNANGRLRDTVYYSILRSEWPASREILKARLSRN
ncbi:MAG: RimJ/RimL family protein N-acetyltransferase [Rhodothermales bacterium]|jgi:RimJ/RimL family protein N-acetyltransferase